MLMCEWQKRCSWIWHITSQKICQLSVFYAQRVLFVIRMWMISSERWRFCPTLCYFMDNALMCERYKRSVCLSVISSERWRFCPTLCYFIIELFVHHMLTHVCERYKRSAWISDISSERWRIASNKSAEHWKRKMLL